MRPSFPCLLAAKRSMDSTAHLRWIHRPCISCQRPVGSGPQVKGWPAHPGPALTGQAYPRRAGVGPYPRASRA